LEIQPQDVAEHFVDKGGEWQVADIEQNILDAVLGEQLIGCRPDCGALCGLHRWPAAASGWLLRLAHLSLRKLPLAIVRSQSFRKLHRRWWLQILRSEQVAGAESCAQQHDRRQPRQGAWASRTDKRQAASNGPQAEAWCSDHMTIAPSRVQLRGST